MPLRASLLGNRQLSSDALNVIAHAFWIRHKIRMQS
jgi:hypothetical protein